MGDLGATYDDHLRLVGKRVGDFLVVLIELFSLGRTAEAPTSDYRFKIGDFAPRASIPLSNCYMGSLGEDFSQSWGY